MAYISVCREIEGVGRILHKTKEQCVGGQGRSHESRKSSGRDIRDMYPEDGIIWYYTRLDHDHAIERQGAR